MIGLLKGWVNEKLRKMYEELEIDHKNLKEKYKEIQGEYNELQKENEELLKDYSLKVEEINELKMEKISRDNPNFREAEKKERYT